MKKLGKKNLEALNTVEAYAGQWDYDNCTIYGKYRCGEFDYARDHRIANDAAWQINFEDILYGRQ